MRVERSGLLVVAVASCAIAACQWGAGNRASPLPGAVPTPAEAAWAVLAQLPPATLPSELQASTPTAHAVAWARWSARAEDRARERVWRGEEDSAVNLLLFGTSFTSRPRMFFAALASGFYDPEVLRGRTDDMIAAARSHRRDDRLDLVRDILRRAQPDPDTASDHAREVQYLNGLVRRVVDEQASFVREIDRAQSASEEPWTLYRERGLAPDASIYPDFAIEKALEWLADRGALRPGAVRRVGIIGPGLDLADKFGGYDVYPVESIQPFAAVDSLRRSGLAAPDAQIFALDVNPRVVAHLEVAARSLQSGYVISLPHVTSERWRSELSTYVERFGDRIGTPEGGYQAAGGAVDIRQVRVAPDVVGAVRALEFNVLTRRLAAPLAAPRGNPGERCDLVVATNVLTYYAPFEQALAFSNMASMLAARGVLLTNTPLSPMAAIPLKLLGSLDVVYTLGREGDRVFAYVRSD